MNFSYYIAKRYAFSKSKNKAINVITAIASAGIIVSAIAMFVVLSVFSGLRTFSLSFVNDLDPDLKVFSTKGKSFLAEDAQIQTLWESGLFQGVSRVIEDRLLFTFKEKQVVAYVKGVDSDYSYVSDYDEKVEYGNWFEYDTNECVVGLGIARMLTLGLFDNEHPFEAVAIKPGEGVIESPEEGFVKKGFYPVGVYYVANEELDDKYIFAEIDEVRKVLSIPHGEITNIELKLAAGVSEKQGLALVNQVFGDSVVVKNKIQLNDGLYRMLNTENFVVYLIFVLVVIMALFTLIGALIMIILEKQPNIRTLFNLGVEQRNLKSIFLYQGLIITIIGSIVGILFGALLVLLQEQFSLILIREGLAYPVEFDLMNVLIVFVSIAVLGYVASYIASARVNRDYLNIPK
ncbi:MULTISPECIES: ABC transporter permease [Myroides]|uniref:FtsX-like permease family protein n=1 Tax=Myroides albus TaxID=2562892 RepID=A0A6I3LGA3_9FLAO|nr:MULTISPECIES: FtsX-like permease family protein [Myroides]MTG96917.1 FtsX-like permease family protein [Myroides albus]MVX35504.1 FtsX-like permease family protein [Myroides sp. LoEW2-1]UVD78333.1 ABC transporter permease [Myroides albus]